MPFSTNCFRFPEYDGQNGRSILVAVGRGCRRPIRARAAYDNSAVRWVIWQLLGNRCTCWIRSWIQSGATGCALSHLKIFDGPLVNENTLKDRLDEIEFITSHHREAALPGEFRFGSDLNIQNDATIELLCTCRPFHKPTVSVWMVLLNHTWVLYSVEVHSNDEQHQHCRLMAWLAEQKNQRSVLFYCVCQWCFPSFP